MNLFQKACQLLPAANLLELARSDPFTRTSMNTYTITPTTAQAITPAALEYGAISEYTR